MTITDFSQPSPIIVEAFANEKPGNILDVGSGYGRNDIYLASLGWKVTALDIDKNATNHIDEVSKAQNLNIRTVTASINSYVTDQRFDSILCLMTLHFLNKDDIRKSIDFIQDHTNVGGLNVITVFTNKNKPNTRPYLFKDSELNDYYTDWKVELYEENIESSVKHDTTGNIMTYIVTRLIARKK